MKSPARDRRGARRASNFLEGDADARQTPSVDGWKTYEVTARVEVLEPLGVMYIWLPTALNRDSTPYQKTLSNKFVATAAQRISPEPA